MSTVAETFDFHVQKALDDVRLGRPLRFINKLYRTKEVCLQAMLSDSNDLECVPMGNLDYVMNNMREKEGLTDLYKWELQMTYQIRKENEKDPDYYGNGLTLQDLFGFWQVSDYDGILRARYDIEVNKNIERYEKLKADAEANGCKKRS